MLLEIKGLETFYGASQALFGVELDVAEGEVVALMGRNGMGKTTTIRSIMALTLARAGSVSFRGAKSAPWRRSRSRVSALDWCRRGGAASQPHRRREPVAAARPGRWTLDEINRPFPRLAERRDQMAKTLSGGESSRCWRSARADDQSEPAHPRRGDEGLAPVIRNDIWAVIRTSKRKGSRS